MPQMLWNPRLYGVERTRTTAALFTETPLSDTVTQVPISLADSGRNGHAGPQKIGGLGFCVGRHGRKNVRGVVDQNLHLMFVYRRKVEHSGSFLGEDSPSFS